MCCQTTPAIGIDPMNPITTMRLRLIRKKTPNAQRRTSNVEQRKFGVGRWAFGVGSYNESPLKCFTTAAGFPATTVFGSTFFVTTAPAATTEFSPMVTPFKITAFIPIQTLSEILTGAVFHGGRAGRFLKYGASASASMRRCAGSSG